MSWDSDDEPKAVFSLPTKRSQKSISNHVFTSVAVDENGDPLMKSSLIYKSVQSQTVLTFNCIWHGERPTLTISSTTDSNSSVDGRFCDQGTQTFCKEVMLEDLKGIH